MSLAFEPARSPVLTGGRSRPHGIQGIGASFVPGMPSVLAEISFITHQQEGKLLKTPAYRQKIAEALCAGVQDYQRSLKAVKTVARKLPAGGISSVGSLVQCGGGFENGER